MVLASAGKTEATLRKRAVATMERAILPSPLEGEGGRAERSEKRGRMRGAWR
jgi:hypothetical protein